MAISMYVILDSITVEPVMLLHSFIWSLTSPTTSALWYRKVCMTLYHSDWICDNLKSDNNTLQDIESHVQKVNAQWDFYHNFCFTLPSLFITFIYGSWSDKISRKIPIILPFLGGIAGASIYLCCAVYIESGLGFMLISSLVQGFLGGGGTQYMAVMSYISDISTVHSRTFRISIVYACSNIGSFLASTISGLLLEATGFVFVYAMCIIINFIAIIYVVFGLRDIKGKKETDPSQKSGAKTRIKELCDLSHVKESLLVTFRKRPDNQRKSIVVVIILTFFVVIGMSLYSISYLYLVHPPLSFSQTLYGYYRGYSTLIHCSCLFILVPLLKKKFHISDSVLLISAILSTMCGSLVYAFSVEAWMVFLSPVASYMQAGLFAFIRAILTSIVRVDEIGQIFAVVAALESIGGLLASLLYGYFLYPATIDIFAGFCYIISVIILLIPLSLAIWFHTSLKKTKLNSDEVYMITDDLKLDDDTGMVFSTVDGDRY